MTIQAPEKTPPLVKAPKTTRSWTKTLVYIFLWQLVAILLVELVLFCAGLGEEEIFKLDPVLGTKHMQNKRITWRTEGYAQSYFNADGLREPGITVAKPANTLRVAFLGDSLIEGLQVPIEQCFSQLLDKQLNTTGQPNVQCIDFGTSGYSTVQEYLQLKSSVIKYHPDLVVVCYNNRAIFENWSVPDQVITNIRPLALHLPGGKLIVDNSSVLGWMRTPRARFLQSIGWIREHSHIWGVWSTWELDMSMHNKAYQALLNMFTYPKKAFGELLQALKPQLPSTPSFNIRFFEKESAKTTTPAPTAPLAATPSATSNGSTTNANKAPDGRQIYKGLIYRTMSSLLNEMQNVCQANGAKLVVISVPARAGLCPTYGMETSFVNIDYPTEINMVSNMCSTRNIPFFDCQAQALKLPLAQRASLFYSVHFTPAGHVYLAGQIEPFIKDQLAQLSSARQATQ